MINKLICRFKKLFYGITTCPVSNHLFLEIICPSDVYNTSVTFLFQTEYKTHGKAFGVIGKNNNMLGAKTL